jgi:hypothetical protein
VSEIRQKLAESAKQYQWEEVLALLTENPELVNTSRPGGRSLYAPLHQAAHGGAPVEVVQGLLDFGAWRSLRNAKNERPLDIARRCGHDHLLGILQPEYRRHVPQEILKEIQSRFHEVIRERAGHLVEQYSLRLPELEPLLEMENPKAWFPVPDMFGGFSYRLEGEGQSAKLISSSWCRIVEGSGQRHEITASGSRLVEEGFV